MELANGYAISLALPGDIPALQQVDLAASRLFANTGLIEEEGGPLPIPEAPLLQGINTRLLFKLTCPSGQPVGFVLASKRRPDLYLDQVSVDPEHGKRGLGAALVRRIISEADHQRFRGVTLSTFRDVAWNGPFYTRLGFAELPRYRMKGWMRALEMIQSETMDVSLRCFMRRPGAWDRHWIRRMPMHRVKTDISYKTDP